MLKFHQGNFERPLRCLDAFFIFFFSLSHLMILEPLNYHYNDADIPGDAQYLPLESVKCNLDKVFIRVN